MTCVTARGQSRGQVADSAVSIATSATLTGIVWKWEGYEDASESRQVVIDDPDKYTLIFLANGAYRAKADCNRMQGQYTLEGGRIRIVLGPATLAECAPGSRYLDYLRNLTEAVSFVVHDNKRVLNLAMKGENWVFESGGPASS